MIRCLPRQLEQRCQQRGYTLQSVEPCIVQRHEDSTITVDEKHPAYPHARRGVGDYVADCLSAIGVTKQRVSRLFGRPCGCKKRQQWLNDVGRRFLGIGGTPSE